MKEARVKLLVCTPYNRISMKKKNLAGCLRANEQGFVHGICFNSPIVA